jgi:ATF/CREB family transcription factor
MATVSASTFQHSESGDDEDIIMTDVGGKENSRKMTDEEKRKNFLERNRFVILTDSSCLFSSPHVFDIALVLPEVGSVAAACVSTSTSSPETTICRVAALKCRQRKKQWLANLQAKVEIFSSENDALSAQVTQLREEIVNLKTLLLAHKDCPISQAQGLSSMNMNGLAADYSGHGHGHGHANPYSMAMATAPSVMAARGVPRR